MKYSHKEIVALFDSAKSTYEESAFFAKELSQDIQDAEMLIKRTIQRIEIQKAKYDVQTEKMKHAKARINELTPWIGESRAFVNEESRLRAQLEALENRLDRVTKVRKEWMQLT